MNDTWYRFRVGAMECFAVSDGTFTYAPPRFPPPMAFLFANAPPDLLGRKLREHNIGPGQMEAWVSPYTCTLVDTGRHLVLIDTGAGNLGPDTGKLPGNLCAAGFSPGDIDIVILTHGHPDHIGGNTDQEGNLIFPNARYVMGEKEWVFCRGGLEGSPLDEEGKHILRKVAKRKLPIIENRLDLVDGERKITAGITAVPAPGHTPGHLALSLSSRGEHLLCLADAMLHPLHIEQPDWHAMIDVSPEKSEETRHRLLDRAAGRNTLVIGFHFPFPGIGRVVRTEDGWKWQQVPCIQPGTFR